jgi:mono/diheme cytochrome c family protein
MSDDNKVMSNLSEAEPPVTRSAAPMWLFVLTLMLIFLGGVYFDHHSGWFSAKIYAPYASGDELALYQPKSGAAAVAAHGKQVYEAICGICHGNDGAGKPSQAPPLAGSEWVTTRGFNRLAHIPLAGLAGPIQVEGKDWNLNMAAMGAALSDADLAAVLTYIRAAWGNKTGEVTEEEVRRIRAEIGKQLQPATADQLKNLPE